MGKNYLLNTWRMKRILGKKNETYFQSIFLNGQIQFKYRMNHRVVGVRQDLWSLSSPTPLLKQNQLEQIAQNHI